MYDREEKRLILEDVLAPPAETIEQVWEDINNDFVGLEDLKQDLKDIQDWEEAQKIKGKTPKLTTLSFKVQRDPGNLQSRRR